MSGTWVVPYQPRRPEIKCTIDTYTQLDQPMNYGFFGLENLEGAYNEDPRPPMSPRKGKHTVQQTEGKSHGRCLRLNNNSLNNLEKLVKFTDVKFDHWKDIAWIDLSQNEIQKLGAELTEFENLQILYLHGNGIADIAQLDLLVPLRKLRKLTLHGNPIDSIRGYRWLVLSKLPQLQCLDFSCVTKAERKTAATWEGMNCFGLKRKKKVEENE